MMHRNRLSPIRTCSIAVIVLAIAGGSAAYFIRAQLRQRASLFQSNEEFAADRIDKAAMAIRRGDLSPRDLLASIGDHLRSAPQDGEQSRRNAIVEYALRFGGGSDEDWRAYADRCWHLAVSRDVDKALTVVVAIPFDRSLLRQVGIEISVVALAIDSIQVCIGDRVLSVASSAPAIGESADSHLFITEAIDGCPVGSTVRVQVAMRIIRNDIEEHILMNRTVDISGELVDIGVMTLK